MHIRQLIGIALIAVSPAVIATPAGKPAPDLTPTEVVESQLAALRDNGDDDNGIARAYHFASPDNRASIGGLSAFTRMIHEGYQDMLRHQKARILDTETDGDEALVRVILDLPGGGRSAYVFVLTRSSTAGCEQCWMTSGVMPVAPPADQGQMI
ncbi:DUF4864 domain-containing protein [Spectribacter hydrogenooxidans]|uniref:DUF4864 domain-containing protein n=1 Tax=Spectribacter hydrogenoxidans TaxID=3075608 RepID=A0ABU3C3C5_9GAMM|nr:DUF4864 domain-containing protein [Salinisphaera sp. W335]MDT0636062.1 DUF4864 domain-containing protein [Salinisphaera sp. W335]